MRRHGFYYRGASRAEPAAALVNDRFNYLTPIKKPVGFGTDRNGRRRRLYDKPATPLDRLLAAGVLSPTQESDLVAYRDSLNPRPDRPRDRRPPSRPPQTRQGQTEQLYLASFPTALPDVRIGIRIKAG